MKPTNAVFPPTAAGMLTGNEMVNVSADTTVSVIVMVRFVPSDVIGTWKISPLCRFTPPPNVVAGRPDKRQRFNTSKCLDLLIGLSLEPCKIIVVLGGP